MHKTFTKSCIKLGIALIPVLMLFTQDSCYNNVYYQTCILLVTLCYMFKAHVIRLDVEELT